MADIIKKLAPHVANLIAAGEVVQRPASVIKELCENSADAGAKNITVEFTDGAMTFLRVSDDGCGMSPGDAVMAFQRHATSKISDGDDLDRIMTHGFRGEALASIAAVSRIDLMTRLKGSIEGTSVSLEGGSVTENIPAGCPEGTTIIVRDIFFNTPARMKYVKKNTTEAAAAVTAVQLQALAHPEISFRLIRDGREVFHTAGAGDLKSAIYDVCGREFAAGLTEVKGSYNDVEIAGYVTRPTASRGTRSGQHFIVNARPISSKLLTSALEEGCKTRIPISRYPGCVIRITVKPTSVDVNVHPAKQEVKFSREREVYDSLYYAVLSAMTGDEGRPEMQLKPPVKDIVKTAQITNQTTVKAEPKSDMTFRSMTVEDYRRMMEKAAAISDKTAQKAVIPAPIPTAAERDEPRPEPPKAPVMPAVIPEEPLREEPPVPVKEEAPQGPEQQSLPLPGADVPYYKYIGEAFDTYIIIEEKTGLLLIDKHAAHERIMFEKLKESEGPPMSQLLIVPEIVKLSPKEAQAILSHTDEMAEAGFEVEDMGDDCVMVRQIPSFMEPGDILPVLEEMAEELLKGRNKPSTQRKERLLYTLACHSAIRAGSRSDPAELRKLAEEVLTRPDVRYCPHGRPVTVSLTRAQLERQFGR